VCVYNIYIEREREICIRSKFSIKEEITDHRILLNETLFRYWLYTNVPSIKDPQPTTRDAPMMDASRCK
jgi:hypothetical protein